MPHSAAAPRRRSSWFAVPLVCVTLLSACSATEPDDAPTTPSATVTAAPAPSVSAAPPSAEAAPEIPEGDGGPEDSFRTWLTASRAPDADLACAYMTPELAQRMVDEITAQGLPGITDCPSLIGMTSALYAAAGQSHEASVEVREQADDRAVLHVTYIEGRSCGQVVLRPGDGHWLLDERSTEEC